MKQSIKAGSALVWLVLSGILVCMSSITSDAVSIPANRNFAFILLQQAKFPKADEIARAFPSFSTEGWDLRLRDSKHETSSVSGLEFEISKCASGVIMNMPIPVPNGEAESAVKFSVSSMRGDWKLPDHKAHLVVAVLESPGSTSRVEGLSCFTSLIAAIAQASRAVGIHWSNAGATHDAEFFMAVASEKELAPRMLLWSGVSIAQESDRQISLLSLGMEQLDLPNLLLVGPRSEANHAVETFFDLLVFAVNRGGPIPDGDTVGRTEEEKLTVDYVPSPIDSSKQVWRVKLK